jgi:hypothetical protein
MPDAPAKSEDQQNRPSWPATVPRWLSITAAVVALLSFPAVILDLLTKDRYLPSSDWLEASRPAVYALWLVWSLALLFVCSVQHKRSTAKGAAVAVGAILIFFPAVGNLVRTSVPALVATVAGTDVQHAYKVTRADGSGGKICHTPIELAGMPFMTKLCNTGEEFRSRLHPGQTVTFGGQGTWMGLYVEYMLQPDEPTTSPRPRPQP